MEQGPRNIVTSRSRILRHCPCDRNTSTSLVCKVYYAGVSQGHTPLHDDLHILGQIWNLALGQGTVLRRLFQYKYSTRTGRSIFPYRELQLQLLQISKLSPTALSAFDFALLADSPRNLTLHFR